MSQAKVNGLTFRRVKCETTHNRTPFNKRYETSISRGYEEVEIGVHTIRPSACLIKVFSVEVGTSYRKK